MDYLSHPNRTSVWSAIAVVIVTLSASLAVVATPVDAVAEEAELASPGGPAVDVTGNVFVADSANNVIRKITPARVVTTVAGFGKVTPVKNHAGIWATFTPPVDVTIDAKGLLYVADNYNHQIRKIDPDSGKYKVTTLTGGSQGFADGTSKQALFYQPRGGAAHLGKVYVADRYNNRLRVAVTATGSIDTTAGGSKVGYLDGLKDKASFTQPLSLAVDDNGTVYMVEVATDGHIRWVTDDGLVSTFKGTPAKSEQPLGSSLGGIAVDVYGAVYVSEQYAIRKLTPNCAL